jgi:hypothetical protein
MNDQSEEEDLNSQDIDALMNQLVYTYKALKSKKNKPKQFD